MIKRLLSYKWLKMVLVVMLGTVIVFVFFTYREQADATEDANTRPVAEEAVEDETPPEAVSFYQAVEALRLQADNANTISDWPEKRQLILDIGEKLKEILDSDDAALLTNHTFITDEFSVVISDYPLSSGTIRRVTYTLKGDDDAESRFFLQYIGETEFFSDIEYAYTDADLTDEHNFQVFENTDGCFAFLIFSSGYEYTTFNSHIKIADCRARIYIPKEDEFYVEQDVDIPLKITSGRSFRLLQMDDVIELIISDHQNEPLCIFNSSELAFEFPKGNLESEPVGYDMPGLLLGLSDSKGNIRTLFIRKESDKVCSDEYSGQIIISRKDKLFSIEPYIIYKDLYEEFETETDYPTGNIDIKKLRCASLDIDLDDDFNNIFKSAPQWTYYTINDIPLYIGEDYICYIQNIYESGGGTFKTGSANLRFDKLDNLADFTLDGWLYPNFQESTLADLIYGKNAETLYKEDVSTYGGKLQPYVDFRQLAIKRNLGKWSLMLPVIDEYYHPGNGSYYKSILAFAAYDNNVPGFLDANGEAVELAGGWRDWDAKDIFKFPGSKVTLTQHDYFIGLRCDEDDYESYVLSIPVNFDEYIVSINFAGHAMQEAWINELRNVKR